jgi:hypothetical protein
VVDMPGCFSTSELRKLGIIEFASESGNFWKEYVDSPLIVAAEENGCVPREPRS